MSRWMRFAAWFGASALALLTVFASTRVAERGRFVSPYSSLGGGPDGTLALARLAQELGYRTEAHARELSHLRTRGTLVAIGGCRGGLVRELSRPEREELTRWVEAGGLLIVAGVPDYAPAAAGLHKARAATCRDASHDRWLDTMLQHFTGETEHDEEHVPRALTAEPVGPPLTNMAPFSTTGAFTVRAEDDAEATVLLASDFGPLGMTTPLGRGRVVLLGISDALTNDALSTGGGVVFARLLQAFAPKGPVWFDEYHLGMGERRSLVRYLRDLGYAAPLAQLALVLFVGLVASAARLGEPQPERVAKVRSTRRYLAALGSLYARTRDEQGALDVLAQRTLTRIARHYRAVEVPLHQLSAWLFAQGLAAASTYTRRIEDNANRPLARGESLALRAQQMDEDAAAAIALGDAP